MKLRLVLIVSALALLAASCGDSSQAVATVNDTAITANFMASLRESYTGTLNVNTEQFRNDLSQNIIVFAVRDVAESELGISISDAEIAERLNDPPPRWQALIAEIAADEDTTDAYAESQAELSILRDRVTAELIRRQDGFIEGTLSETPQELTAGCVRHILVETEAEAEAAAARLEAGEDFVALAEEVTTDTATGGAFVGGCPVGFGGFVPAFAVAATRGPLNQVIGPVQSGFGFHLILVEQRVGPPTLEEVTADPIRYLPGAMLSNFFTSWFNDAVRESEISVAPAVGRWSVTGVGIVPPGQ